MIFRELEKRVREKMLKYKGRESEKFKWFFVNYFCFNLFCLKIFDLFLGVVLVFLNSFYRKFSFVEFFFIFV